MTPPQVVPGAGADPGSSHVGVSGRGGCGPPGPGSVTCPFPPPGSRAPSRGGSRGRGTHRTCPARGGAGRPEPCSPRCSLPGGGAGCPLNPPCARGGGQFGGGRCGGGCSGPGCPQCRPVPGCASCRGRERPGWGRVGRGGEWLRIGGQTGDRQTNRQKSLPAWPPAERRNVPLAPEHCRAQPSRFVRSSPTAWGGGDGGGAPSTQALGSPPAF